MQDHEKNLLLLIAIGAAIGFAKLLVSDEKLTWRLTIGRTILGAATSTIAGAIILQIPDINPLALISLASSGAVSNSDHRPFGEVDVGGEFRHECPSTTG